MSRKRNTEKEMFQPTTECINSLAIDDIAGQAVPSVIMYLLLLLLFIGNSR